MARNEFPFVQTISEFTKHFYRKLELPESALNTVIDTLSPGQIASKNEILRLSESILNPSMRTFFIAHWHGFLPRLLKNYGLVERASGIELDPLWVNFSKLMNADWEWNSLQGDASLANFDHYDFIFNTSCEHMTDEWMSNVKSNSIVLAQSTNYRHPAHINLSNSLSEFQSKFNNYEVLDMSEINCELYARYTILGRKK